MEPDPPQTGASYAWLGPIDGAFDDVSPFDDYFNAGWAFLLDGTGTVEAFLAPVTWFGGVMVVPPEGTLTTATLILDLEFPDQLVATATWTSIKALYR